MEDNGLRIANIRFGFANNSSSSHSMIFVDDGDSRRDHGSRVVSKKGKADFFAYAFCAEAAGSGVDPRVALMAVRDLLGVEANPRQLSGETGHPWAFPRKMTGEIDMDFARELADFVMRRDVGADFSENDDRFCVPGPDCDNSDTVSRKDPLTGVWTLYSRRNGTKVRFAFPPKGERTPLEDLEDDEFVGHPVSTPELADVKITSFCDNEQKPCAKHCYQASGPAGAHASLGNLILVAERLAAAEVFEVALGGGEPTSHPDFVKVLNIFESRGIVPNFTTSETAWMDSPDARDILMTAGGFAFSAMTPEAGREAMAKYDRTCKRLGIEPGFHRGYRAEGEFAACPTVQHVLGTAPLEQLRGFMGLREEFGCDFTLLGFKTAGRGAKALGDAALASRVQGCEDGWLGEIRRAARRDGYVQVSIDTALAKKSAVALSAGGVSNVSFHFNEGDFSVYVDAVRMRMSKSSYDTAPGDMTDFGTDWLDVFSKYGVDNAAADARRTLRGW